MILTPCTANLPFPAKTAAEYDDPATFVPLIIGSIASYAPRTLSRFARVGARGLMPSCHSHFASLCTDGRVAPRMLAVMGLNGLPIPSITLPTAARHYPDPELGGGALPAGVLLWARPQDDKKLIEVAMALEVALAAS